MSLVKRKGWRFLALAAAVLCLAMSLVVFVPAARAGVCEDALGACMVDAVTTMTHNLMAGVSYAMFCTEGYTFCLRYYAEA